MHHILPSSWDTGVVTLVLVAIAFVLVMAGVDALLNPLPEGSRTTRQVMAGAWKGSRLNPKSRKGRTA